MTNKQLGWVLLDKNNEVATWHPHIHPLDPTSDTNPIDYLALGATCSPNKAPFYWAKLFAEVKQCT